MFLTACLFTGLALAVPTEDVRKLLQAPVIAGLWESRQAPAAPFVQDPLAEVPLTIQMDKAYLQNDGELFVLRRRQGTDKEFVPVPILTLRPTKEAATTALLTLPAFPRGKYRLFVRNGKKNETLDSAQIEFEVLLPAPPVIVTVFAEGSPVARLPGSDAVAVISSKKILLRANGLGEGDRLEAFLWKEKDKDSLLVPAEFKLVENDRAAVTLDPASGQSPLEANRYNLTLRVIRQGVASELSNRVLVDYRPPCPPPIAVPPAAPAGGGPVPAAPPETVPPPTRVETAGSTGPAAGGVTLDAFKSTDAFPTMPLVRVVVDPLHLPRDLTRASVPGTELDSLEMWARMCHIPLFDARFDGPANFPLPRVGLMGERFADEGAVIHEGMRLVAAADGHYEVRFTTSVPVTAVTMRLQLAVVGPTGQAFSLTLPPVLITPPRYFYGNYLGRSYQVRVNGYSRVLAMHFGDLGQVRIVRLGTARFGSWPEGINEFERLPR